MAQHGGNGQGRRLRSRRWFDEPHNPSMTALYVERYLNYGLTREELQGVIGHEMAHVRDYDIRTMMMIAVLVAGIAMLADFVYRSMWYTGGISGGRRSSRSDSDGGGSAGVLIGLLVLVLAVLAPIFAQLLAMAVSRQREYLADAASVEFTRNPRALLRALERIAQTESPLRNASRGTAHLFIVNPLEGALEDDEGFFDNLLSTHPPLGRRIARLRAMLNEAPGITCRKPEGAFYVYPNISGCIGRKSAGGRLIETDQDFAMALLEEQHVATVHGAGFGMSPYLRISYATDEAALTEACRRIAAFTAGLH